MQANEWDIRLWKSIAYDLSLQLEKVNEEQYQAHDEATGTNFVLEGRYRVYSIIAEFPTEVETEKLKPLVAGLRCTPHDLYVRAINTVSDLEADLQSEDLARWRVNIEKELADYKKHPDKLVHSQSCLGGFPTGLQAKGLEVHVYRGNENSVKRYIENVLQMARSTQL